MFPTIFPQIIMIAAMRLFAILVITATLAACTTPMSLPLVSYEDPYKKARSPGKGLIYIYRERDFYWSGRGIYVLANGKRIGGLNNGTYFVYEAEPGDIVITAENTLDAEATIKRRITVIENGKYYLRGSFKTDVWDGHPYIEIVYDVEGEQAVQSLHYQTLAK